jgi:transcriptional regulator with XRE-family HTH domain
MTTTNPNTGPAIRSARQATGLTQQQAARGFGVSLRTWAYWENGSITPAVVRLRELAEYLGVPITDLL